VTTSNVRGGDRRFAGWQALDEDAATYADPEADSDAETHADSEADIDPTFRCTNRDPYA